MNSIGFFGKWNYPRKSSQALIPRLFSKGSFQAFGTSSGGVQPFSLKAFFPDYGKSFKLGTLEILEEIMKKEIGKRRKDDHNSRKNKDKKSGLGQYDPLVLRAFPCTKEGKENVQIKGEEGVGKSPLRFEDKLDEEQFVHSQGGAQHPELVDILGCNVDHLLTVYLGMPLDNKHKEIVIWDGITGKAEKRLIVWKTQYLLLGGIFILINSDLDSLPTYVMSLFLLSLKLSRLNASLNAPKVWKRQVHQEFLKLRSPYARSVKDSKWLSKSIREAETNSLEENIEVLSQMESHENGLLKRCLVGHLEGGNKEKRTLSEVRRWSSLLWKKAFGVNIYEMYGRKFLFEFPNRNMAEQTLQGQWNWKNQRFNLEWWFPLVGCTPNNIPTKETWVRIIGIPLHLWSSQVFQEIGNLCGGWLATEEETELKNHMMWARILVENDGRNIPKEVSVSRYGVVYHFPIWAESHVRVEMLPEIGKGVPGEENKRSTIPSFTQRFIGCKVCKKGTQSLISRDFPAGEHVGGSWLTADNEERREACERHMPHLNEGEILGLHQQPNTRKRVSRKLGPDYSSQVIFNDILGKDAEDESSNISLDFVES
ncbi:hypothetical protein MTR67_039730 [Solanum verrucosum]|uniref:DUF4283 domain-containing protein n=1 Tax=Solanum verrucosum TaxID=315347 RepID=A0AAF0UHE7_SOLVR|nr:hypothetical protein MTR67_039730 [Solanum verrucosum]